MLREKAGIEGVLVVLLTTILVSDIAILLDIPIYRQVLGFACFAVIPGYLVVLVLRLRKVGLLKGLLLSVGLSISFLLLASFALNMMLPPLGLHEPLSPFSLVVFLSIALLALCYLAYQRNKLDYTFPSLRRLLSRDRSTLLFPVLLPFMLPMMSVVGTQYMNTELDNTILLALFLVVPVYLVSCVLLSKSISNATYPIAIYMVSLALLLARGLTSNYLVGGDIYSEYHSYQQTSHFLSWPGAVSHSMITDSLGVSLLPVVFESILGVGSLMIFKAVLLLLISAVPVVCYLICEKYLGTLKAFLASFFFVAQIPFLDSLSGQIRVGVALIFFSLAILILVDNSLEEHKKKFLFIVFSVSLVLSYYVTPVIFLVLVAFVVGVQSRNRVFAGTYGVSSRILIFLSVIVFLWWGRASMSGAFESYAAQFREIFSGLADFFLLESRSSTVQHIGVLTAVGLSTRIVAAVNDISFLLILVGTVSSFLLRDWRRKISLRYRTLMSASCLLLLAWIVLPAVSVGYDAGRVYLQLLVVLAAAFLIGFESVLGRRRRGFAIIAVTIMVVALFFCNTGLLNHFAGSPNNEVFDKDCEARDSVYVYGAEVTAADWIGANSEPSSVVFLGSISQFRGLFEFSDYWEDNSTTVYSFRNLSTYDSSAYVFLRYVNIVKGYGYMLDERDFMVFFELSDYTSLLNREGVVYDNGYAEIYYPS